MAIRVAINGFGRIGRLVFRALAEDDRFQVVAVNDLADAKSLSTLLRYDSVHGKFRGTVEVESEEQMRVNGVGVHVYGEREISALPWGKHEIDFVVESTGVFRKRAQIEQHVAAGA
ncbi:MAG: glyceraldehyde 3-phosphate dehydrogenase NAD-binding domain-containing protein, partial [Planctomycetota bacterium]